MEKSKSVNKTIQRVLDYFRARAARKAQQHEAEVHATIQRVCERLKSPDVFERTLAVKWLGWRAERDDALQAVVNALGDDQGLVRLEATEAILKHRERALPKVVDAIRAGRIRRDCAETLMKELRDLDNGVRTQPRGPVKLDRTVPRALAARVA